MCTHIVLVASSYYASGAERSGQGLGRGWRNAVSSTHLGD